MHGKFLTLTTADILPSKRIDINKNYAKVRGEELFLEPKTPKAGHGSGQKEPIRLNCYRRAVAPEENP